MADKAFKSSTQGFADIKRHFQEGVAVPHKATHALQEVAEKNRFVILAENHSDEITGNFQKDKSTLLALRNGGVEHLGIETDRAFQGVIDMFQDNKIGRQAVFTVHDMFYDSPYNKDNHLDTAITIENADRLGMKVHAIDVGNGLLSPQDQEFFDNFRRQAMIKAAEIAQASPTKLNSYDNQTDFLRTHFPDSEVEHYLDLKSQQEDIYEQDWDSFMRSRLSQDEKLANYALSRIGKNDNLAIQIGADHANRKLHDVPFYLGQDQTATVRLYGSRPEEPSILKQLSDFAYGAGTESPDHTLYIQEGVWQTEEGQTFFLNAQPQQTVPSADPDEPFHLEENEPESLQPQ